MERQRSFYLPRYLSPVNIGGYEVYAHRSAFYDSVNTDHLRERPLSFLFLVRHLFVPVE